MAYWQKMSSRVIRAFVSAPTTGVAQQRERWYLVEARKLDQVEPAAGVYSHLDVLFDVERPVVVDHAVTEPCGGVGFRV